MKTYIVWAHKKGDNWMVVAARNMAHAMERGQKLLGAPIIKVMRDESKQAERVEV